MEWEWGEEFYACGGDSPGSHGDDPRQAICGVLRVDDVCGGGHFAGMELKTKVVGTRRRATDPAACHQRAIVLMRLAEKVCPFPRPRGFVFKARSWGEYEAWKKAQPNPRLW